MITIIILQDSLKYLILKNTEYNPKMDYIQIFES